MSRIAVRVEPRRWARQLMLGLLSDLPRKNCWTIAEWAGERTPDGMQHLLGRAKWDADQVRDDLRDYVVEHLHDDQAGLVVDETGDVKKGTGTVGVQRQYTGTAGRIENAQVAVYLVYAGRRGHAAVGPGTIRPALLDLRHRPLPGCRTRPGHRLRDQAGTGHPHDHPVPGLRPHIVGHGRRGLRRQRETAGRTGGTRHRLRARRGLLGRSHHQSREVPRRRPGQKASEADLAKAVRRSGGERAPLLRLGCNRPEPTPPPAAASCWSAATAAPANSPTTAATHPHRCR